MYRIDDFQLAMDDLRGAENQKESFIKKMAEAKRWASTSIRYGAPNMPLSLEEKQELEREMLQTIHTGFIGKKLNEQRVQKFGRQVSVDDNDYYQADELKAAYQALIDPAEITPPGAESDVRIHLIITGRGVSSKELDGSIHCRIGSFSAGLGVISTTGLLDGPAGPAQYEELLLKYDQTSSDLGFHDPLVKMGKWEQYKKARDKLGMNKPLLALRVAFPEQMLLPDDPRMTGVAKGLCLQAIFFGTGVIQNPSCSHSTPSGPDMSKTCRFHDAHRQEELLNCQVHKPQFCPFHSRILELLEK